MSNYILSCCSTVDLSKEHLDSRNIKYVCFNYYLDGVRYDDDLGISMSSEDFYAAMANGADTKTSQVNADRYEQHFEQYLKEGLDIVHVCLSSGLSGSCNSAAIAWQNLCEKYPDRRVYIIDSLAASSGSGLLVDTLADLRDGGMEAEELARWAEENKLRLNHWFFATDLTFFVKGGRVSKASGWFGTVLNICPLLNVDSTGHLIPRYKVRGKDACIKKTVEKMQELADGGLNYSGKCFISNSACYEDAKKVAELIEAKFKKLDGKVLINNIGTTIGSHTGPGTVALFFWGKERVD